MLKCNAVVQVNLLFVNILVISKVNAVTNTSKCISIRKINYVKEIIYHDIGGPYNLVIDYHTNNLFFSYTSRKIDHSVQFMPTFELAYLNLKSNEFGPIGGIRGGFATAINHKAHKVYMGGEDGIYFYDYDTNHATHLNTVNASIWQMFNRNGLYFTTFPDQKVFFYKYEETMELPELKGKLLAVKKDGDYLLANTTGLFFYNRANGKGRLIGYLTLNSFTTDTNDNLYFSTSSGIYSIDDKTNKIERLAQINDIFGFAIEKNGNMIYSNKDSIIRLRPTEMKCSNETVKNNKTKSIK